eukprot:3169480-Prymnesium_polylepis.2
MERATSDASDIRSSRTISRRMADGAVAVSARRCSPGSCSAQNAQPLGAVERAQRVANDRVHHELLGRKVEELELPSKCARLHRRVRLRLAQKCGHRGSMLLLCVPVKSWLAVRRRPQCPRPSALAAGRPGSCRRPLVRCKPRPAPHEYAEAPQADGGATACGQSDRKAPDAAHLAHPTCHPLVQRQLLRTPEGLKLRR